MSFVSKRIDVLDYRYGLIKKKGGIDYNQEGIKAGK